MYDNIGEKIKALAKGTFIVETIGVFVLGIGLIASDDGYFLVSILMFLLGPIVAWLSSLTLYGFGELIERIANIEEEFLLINFEKTNDKVQETQTTFEASITNNHQATHNLTEQKKIRCPHCSFAMNIGDTQCKNCGQTFKWNK